MKHAVLFGCNYANDRAAQLRGCINDVLNVEGYLKEIGFDRVDVFTDEKSPNDTTAVGIMSHINELAVRSWRETLDIVWIHFSGHGCQVKDWNGDEKDGMDECIVPSNYKKAGIIRDDNLSKALCGFHPSTRIIAVFDCCHSGTILDLPHRYLSKTTKSTEATTNIPEAHVVLISGCRDDQTSADAFNVANRMKFTGAMTSCLLQTLKETPTDLFDLQNKLHVKLRAKNFTQVPQICSSFELKDDCGIFWEA
jgi:hypothetical protein